LEPAPSPRERRIAYLAAVLLGLQRVIGKGTATPLFTANRPPDVDLVFVDRGTLGAERRVPTGN